MTVEQDRAFLDALYGHLDAHDVSEEEILDLVYREVDDRLLAGEFDAVSRILDAVDLEKLTTVVALAFASITRLAAHELTESRPAFMARLRKILEIVDPERVDDLLQGLEAA
ncbi:MAG: hypothetical protein ACHREM_08775 [Polyangiales bacterium]